jgi:nucleoside-diphosphate-sugar epimerase
MIVVTGGAGFIGSNLVAGLEAEGERDIVVFDRLGRGDKWRNLAKHEIAELLPPERLRDWLDNHLKIDTIFHLGAISTTTESDADLIIDSNFTLSLWLWEWCARHGVRFIYASSAATYGDGAAGFEDDGGPTRWRSSARSTPMAGRNICSTGGWRGSPPNPRPGRRLGRASNSSTSTARTSITRLGR